MKIFLNKNTYLEEKAVNLCRIEPTHKVLEVGFGLGIGLTSACRYVEAHKGKVYGIDISDKIISTAKQTLQVEIREGKLHIQKGCVSLLPFENDTFDRVFHCNCFHFWPDLLICCRELYRVLKPNSFMVTTLCIKSIKHAREKGLLQYGPQGHLVFIETLEKASFKDVMLDTFEENGKKFEAIIAFT
ncbi:putative methyltransferase YdaC [Mytilus galloprovincialis]|uniref:putative methyltransferase YdaC n=1 Tax=Mytilus galloprovincialis TaxID=29158 RepID=UPI003F7C3E11